MPLFTAFAARATEAGVLSEFTAQGISNTVWAYTVLGVREEGLMHALAAHAIQDHVLCTFGALGITNTAWAFVTLQYVAVSTLTSRGLTLVHMGDSRHTLRSQSKVWNCRVIRAQICATGMGRGTRELASARLGQRSLCTYN